MLKCELSKICTKENSLRVLRTGTVYAVSSTLSAPRKILRTEGLLKPSGHYCQDVFCSCIILFCFCKLCSFGSDSTNSTTMVSRSDIEFYSEGVSARWSISRFSRIPVHCMLYTGWVLELEFNEANRSSGALTTDIDYVKARY